MCLFLKLIMIIDELTFAQWDLPLKNYFRNQGCKFVFGAADNLGNTEKTVGVN